MTNGNAIQLLKCKVARPLEGKNSCCPWRFQKFY